jgi:hypothetical protein
MRSMAGQEAEDGSARRLHGHRSGRRG